MTALKQNLFKAIDFLIRIEAGPDAGKVYRIQPPKIIIGRDPRNQVALTDPKTSRQQLVIKFDNNITCEDLSTRKTTMINGKPCGKTILKPGDIITFGQTRIKFETRTNQNAKPQLAGSAPSTDNSDKIKKQKIFRGLIAVVAVLGIALFAFDAPPQQAAEEKLATISDLNKQIEETEERMTLMREAREEKLHLSDRKYLYSVEKHFISGFRDFQNGRYGRALDSFGTTIATEPSHVRAQLYSKTARKKRDDLIDTHLRDGQKYREKLMYSRCAAEFEKALVYINNTSSKKYEFAKKQLQECRMMKTGGYQ